MLPAQRPGPTPTVTIASSHACRFISSSYPSISAEPSLENEPQRRLKLIVKQRPVRDTAPGDGPLKLEHHVGPNQQRGRQCRSVEAAAKIGLDDLDANGRLYPRPGKHIVRFRRGDADFGDAAIFEPIMTELISAKNVQVLEPPVQGKACFVEAIPAAIEHVAGWRVQECDRSAAVIRSEEHTSELQS